MDRRDIMQCATTPAIIPSNVYYVYDVNGQIMAACATGLVGEARPDDNKPVSGI